MGSSTLTTNSNRRKHTPHCHGRREVNQPLSQTLSLLNNWSSESLPPSNQGWQSFDKSLARNMFGPRTKSSALACIGRCSSFIKTGCSSFTHIICQNLRKSRMKSARCKPHCSPQRGRLLYSKRLLSREAKLPPQPGSIYSPTAYHQRFCTGLLTCQCTLHSCGLTSSSSAKNCHPHIHGVDFATL